MDHIYWECNRSHSLGSLQVGVGVKYMQKTRFIRSETRMIKICQDRGIYQFPLVTWILGFIIPGSIIPVIVSSKRIGFFTFHKLLLLIPTKSFPLECFSWSLCVCFFCNSLWVSAWQGSLYNLSAFCVFILHVYHKWHRTALLQIQKCLSFLDRW